MIRLAVGGFKGRMGQRICALAREDPRFTLAAEFDLDSVGATAAFDVLVDFSTPAGTAGFVELCKERGAGLVIGTTGHDPAQEQRIQDAAAKIAIVQASNFSVGVNVLLDLVAQTARRLGEGFDIEIVETHHVRKVDAPSGTALSMLDAILQATGRTRDKHVIFGRQGQTGAKPKGQIAVHAVRSGDVTGRHEIIFGGTGETITITHEALSRDTFAKGALQAAQWVHDKRPGLYSMKDVLGG